MLKRIEGDGLRLQCVYGIYGAQRDEFVSCSKLVLNLHAHVAGSFEIVRVSYPLANSKAVVTEDSPDIGYLPGAVAVSDRNQMARTCRDLLEGDNQRHLLEQRGYQMFSKNSLLHSLEEAVGASFQIHRK